MKLAPSDTDSGYNYQNKIKDTATILKSLQISVNL